MSSITKTTKRSKKTRRLEPVQVLRPDQSLHTRLTPLTTSDSI